MPRMSSPVMKPVTSNSSGWQIIWQVTTKSHWYSSDLCEVTTCDMVYCIIPQWLLVFSKWHFCHNMHNLVNLTFLKRLQNWWVLVFFTANSGRMTHKRITVPWMSMASLLQLISLVSSSWKGWGWCHNSD